MRSVFSRARFTTSSYFKTRFQNCSKANHSNDLYEKLLEGNRKFVEEKLAQDSEYFKKRAKGQQPKYLLIGCSDSRVPPNQLTKTEPGEIFIHRNVANMVVPTDMNAMSVLQFAVEVLKVEHVIVMVRFSLLFISTTQPWTWRFAPLAHAFCTIALLHRFMTCSLTLSSASLSAL